MEMEGVIDKEPGELGDRMRAVKVQEKPIQKVLHTKHAVKPAPSRVAE